MRRPLDSQRDREECNRRLAGSCHDRRREIPGCRAPNSGCRYRTLTRASRIRRTRLRRDPTAGARASRRRASDRLPSTRSERASRSRTGPGYSAARHARRSRASGETTRHDGGPTACRPSSGRVRSSTVAAIDVVTRTAPSIAGRPDARRTAAGTTEDRRKRDCAGQQLQRTPQDLFTLAEVCKTGVAIEKVSRWVVY